MPVSTPPARVSWFVWGLGAMFYLMGFFQRVAPAVMTAELMRDFQISAAALGNLSAFYFYSYVAMQIPTGIIADRWGPRNLLTSGCLVAAVGTALFALSPNIGWGYLGRFLIGGSVAVAFVGLLKMAANWFPPRKFAMVSGMALFCGIVGAVSAGPPLRLLIDHFPWRGVLLSSAAVTLLVGAGIRLFVRDTPAEKGFANFTSGAGGTGGGRTGILAGIRDVFRYHNTALLFIIPGGIVGCVLTFSGLWGVPYLTSRYEMSTAAASLLTSSLLVAWAVGGPVFGWFSDRLGSRRPPYIAGCAAALLGWIVILLAPPLPLIPLVAVLILTGFGSGCMIIGFAYAKESVPASLSGTVSGVINMGVMMGPMILQPVVGWMLDRRWDGLVVEGARIYSAGAYRAGFAPMIAWAGLSLVLLFFTRETRCRQAA